MAHLTRSSRDQIQALRCIGHSQQEIADVIGCDQSTISREYSRSRLGRKKQYAANTAQQRAEDRRQYSYDDRHRWQDNARLRAHVERELHKKRSPDQIAGRMKERKRKHTVSYQSIYRYIERDKEEGGDLFQYLRYQGKKYKWRGLAKEATRIPNRKGIEDRPATVEAKKEIGHWESDLVVSGKNGEGAVATFAERTGLSFRAILVADTSADEMVRASNDALGSLPPQMRLTMTHDNGHEISKHEKITENLQMTVYCARPYRSCDRGLNEWYNRELRRFFPKGTDFSQHTQSDIDLVVEWLNDCPRRSLNYRTPKEVLREQLKIMRFTR